MRISIIALAIGMLGCISQSAWSQEASETHYRCTSKPCGNTATGEDPQDVLLREARAEQSKIKSDGPDQARWQIPIYSTSTKKSDLEILITKSAKFSMRLSSRPIFAVKAKLITQQGLGDEALGVVRRRAAHAA